MAKQSGLGDQLYLDGYRIGCDVGGLSRIGGGPAALEQTGICKSAFERTGGVRDGAIEFAAWFNPGPEADAAHTVLSTLPTADRIVTYARGEGLGRPAACLVSKQLNYDPTRGTDGALTLAVSTAANGFGLEWGVQATPGVRTDAAATNGASLDLGAGSLFGLQAYVHVFAFTGTDATITVEASSDDGAGDAFAAITGAAFPEITAGPVAHRIQTARDAAVERYVRVATSTTGGFTDLQFAVVVNVNAVETEF